MEAGAVADDGERGHSLPQGHGVEPHERGSRPGPRRRRPAQPFRPPRRVLQPLQPPPKEHRRRRRAARGPVQLVQRQAPASRRRGQRAGRTHRGWVDRTRLSAVEVRENWPVGPSRIK